MGNIRHIVRALAAALPLSLLVLAPAGCSSEAQIVDPGTPDTGSPASDATSEAAADAPVGDPDAALDAIAANAVTLVYGATTTKVDVSTLPTTTYKGASVVALSSLWAAGKLRDDVSTLSFYFEADDGFHPSNKASCSTNITGAQLSKGYLLPATRSLVWDDALGLPGCYSVKAVAKVIGVDATAAPDAGSGG